MALSSPSWNCSARRTSTPAPDRVQYLAKRAEILAVLLTSSRSISSVVAGRCPIPTALSRTYRVLVSRFEERPVAGFWPIGLRQPLPTIPIPLRHGTPDATIELQQILHLV